MFLPFSPPVLLLLQACLAKIHHPVYKVLHQAWICNHLQFNKCQVDFEWNFVTQPAFQVSLYSFESLSLHYKTCKVSILHIFLSDYYQKITETLSPCLIYSKWNTSIFDRRICYSGRCWNAVLPDQWSHSAETCGPLWTLAKLGGDSRTVARALSL